MYKIKEIYYTLQGEGFHTGRPSIFIRFSGCNLWTGLEKDSNNDSRYSMPLFLHPRNEVVLSKKYTAGNYLNERLEEIGLKK